MSFAPNDFTHLHLHSEFSLLDGLGRIDDLVDEAERLGFDSLACTDHGSLYGAVAFYKATTSKGIKPIIGVETYVARRSMRDKEGKADAQPFHLVLLAADMEGYQNLCRLVTDAHVDGYYYKPRIDREHLARYSKGLIGLSACLGGEIPRALETDDWEHARKLAGEYGDIFGPDRFYLELQDHGLPEQRALNEKLLRLAPEAGLPMVITNDLHYVRKPQAEAHDVLLCVGTGNNLDTPNRMRFESEEFYLKSAAEMASLFPDQRQAVLNTKKIAEMVDLKLPLGELRIPHFPVPEGETVESWLRKECEAGLVRRYGAITPELQARLDYELSVIVPMGYAGYFLIVADFTRYAREQRIAITCRGSAPGSIVTYTLGITPVDPLLYQLPFERFLNPDRVTMPDIDVDFEDGRREEVIAYVGRKYGADHVAQIITFGTMLARASLRDVGRVLGMSYGDVDRIAKAVPNQLGIKLEEALEISPQLKEMYAADPQVTKLIDLAKQLEGVARNASTHAAGVVISREPLTDLMPLQKATNSDALMTQYEMHGVEALGLLKFDFLGLSNLTILRVAVDLIRDHRGVEIDLEKIPLDDSKTFELLASGETTGVFQLESGGMRRYIRELRPTSVYDLAAMVALYRPGPMDNIPLYIRRKQGLDPVTYLHPLLEPYLNKTYGVFVYQEDIMAAAVALGGFTGPEADMLGYAIRKKKSQVLHSMKGKFISQAAERGIAADTIDAVFKAFEPFERYGFNKAHATCYGLVAYQTAYLKANYPVEYMTSVLSAFRDKEEKVALAVAECRRLGIEVRTPDVRYSHVEFTVEGEAIRFGLLAVKNVGAGAIESIMAAREQAPFTSLVDFCSRVDLRMANKRVLESLTRVGALNGFGHPAQVLAALDEAMSLGDQLRKERESPQIGLFGEAISAPVIEKPLSEVPEVPVRERLKWEKELMGLYLSDHPLGDLAEPLSKFVGNYAGELKEESLDGQRVVVGGVVTAIRSVLTKAKDAMAVLTVEDLQGQIEVVVFPRTYAAVQSLIEDGAVLLIAGRVDHKGDEVSLLADSVWKWEDVLEKGQETFAQEVAAGDRSRGRGQGGRGGGAGASGGQGGQGGQGGERRWGGPNGNGAPSGNGAPNGNGGNGHSNGNGNGGNGGARRDEDPLRGRVPVEPKPLPGMPPLPGSAPASAASAPASTVPGTVVAPPVEVAPPVPSYDEPADFVSLAPDAEEPPFPDEAAERIASSREAPTAPAEAAANATLHVRFADSTAATRVVDAMEVVYEILRARPGGTRVVVHVPQGTGKAVLPMELRFGVAYDNELLAEVTRRLPDGAARLELTPD